MRSVLLLVLIVVLLIPQSVFAESQFNDRELLIGTWQITVFQDDGRDRLSRLGAGPAKKKGEEPRVAKLVFTNEECYLLRGDGRREVVAGLANAAWQSCKLDESASPKAVDIVGFAGKDGQKTKTYPGIYKIEGEKFTICYCEQGKQRPSLEEIPKPPTSVSPQSRRKTSLAHAVGLNRRTGGRFRGHLNFTGVCFSFTFWTLAIGGTLLADGILAGIARRQTVGTVWVVARLAVRFAAAAGDGLTTGALRGAVTTHHGLTSLAREHVVAATVAVLAALPVPLFEFDVRAAGIVGLERLTHDQEEVEQPALPQRVLDRYAGFPLTESALFDVRVRNVVVAGSWIGIDGDHLIGVAAADPPDVQHNVERPQIDVLQFDGGCLAGDLGLTQIDLDLVELSVECEQVVVDLRRRRDHRPCWQYKRSADICDVIDELFEPTVEFIAQATFRRVPAS